ncbi:hypothetical protein C8Q70DRAFT_698363 [Cubamyces menziesii]|nr:hypothetical protein C8Q70DRAFT_698363 [Cubamyces menziesii]
MFCSYTVEHAAIFDSRMHTHAQSFATAQTNTAATCESDGSITGSTASSALGAMANPDPTRHPSAQHCYPASSGYQNYGPELSYPATVCTSTLKPKSGGREWLSALGSLRVCIRDGLRGRSGVRTPRRHQCRSIHCSRNRLACSLRSLFGAIVFPSLTTASPGSRDRRVRPRHHNEL